MRFWETIFNDFMRDFTGLGNPLVLCFLILLFLGPVDQAYGILIGLLAVEMICALIKTFYHRERPIREHYASLFERLAAASFPSVHMARVTFVFLALFLLSPNPLRWLFLALIMVVGITRVGLNKHFAFDVIAGYVFGFLIFMFWVAFA